MTKKLALKINNEKIKNTVLEYFKNKEVKIVTNPQEADLTASFGSDNEISAKNQINLHPSLLPAFQTKDAIKETFLEGVKVSGITVHYVEENKFFGKIIAQAPILIGQDTHYEEFEDEIIKLGAQIYPIVIETILDDKVFDFSNLFKSNCSGNCSGCHSCKH